MIEQAHAPARPFGSRGHPGIGSWWLRLAFTLAMALVAATVAAIPAAAGPVGAGFFPGWATGSGVQAVSGDFNGDGRQDIALTGGSGWNTVPVAFSNGGGGFYVTNTFVANFPEWAQNPTVKVVAGDVNGDGLDDLMMTGGTGWNTIPVAYSNGDGSFYVTNTYSPDFAWWAQSSTVKLLAGDVNGDGRADLMLTGGAGWNTVPVAFSNGFGGFYVTNSIVASFPWWAQGSNVKVVAGDVNGDGRADLLLTGGAGWNTVPVAFSNGAGGFNVTNYSVANFPWWAQDPTVKVVAGDVNGDGRADLLLTGGAGWNTVPVAFSNGFGGFYVTNYFVPNFPWWAQGSTVKVLGGDVDNDGRADLMLTGGAGWNTVPVGFSGGFGTFYVTNFPA